MFLNKYIKRLFLKKKEGLNFRSEEDLSSINSEIKDAIRDKNDLIEERNRPKRKNKKNRKQKIKARNRRLRVKQSKPQVSKKRINRNHDNPRKKGFVQSRFRFDFDENKSSGGRVARSFRRTHKNFPFQLK